MVQSMCLVQPGQGLVNLCFFFVFFGLSNGFAMLCEIQLWFSCFFFFGFLKESTILHPILDSDCPSALSCTPFGHPNGFRRFFMFLAQIFSGFAWISQFVQVLCSNYGLGQVFSGFAWISQVFQVWAANYGHGTNIVGGPNLKNLRNSSNTWENLCQTYESLRNPNNT